MRPLYMLALLVACGPVAPIPQPVPGPEDWPTGDATDYPDGSPAAATSPCGRACETLSRVGCPEGAQTAGGTSCYRACVAGSRLTNLHTACVARAKDQAAVRACGSVWCGP